MITYLRATTAVTAAIKRMNLTLCSLAIFLVIVVCVGTAFGANDGEKGRSTWFFSSSSTAVNMLFCYTQPVICRSAQQTVVERRSIQLAENKPLLAVTLGEKKSFHGKAKTQLRYRN